MAVISLNRKGYFFSLTVIIALLLVSVYFASFSNPGQSREAFVSSHRINEVNRFLSALEDDASTGISVASLRTILVFEEHVEDTNSFISPYNRFDEIASELLLNGTFDGEEHSLVNESNMNVWVDNIERLGYLGVDLEFEEMNAGLYQDDPWHVKAFFEYRVIARDEFTSSKWNKSVRVEASHPIARFADPVYIVGSRGSYSQNFRKHESPVFPGDLAVHVNEKYYISTSDAPSFLQRFTGMDETSEFGVESLVNIPALSEVGYLREGRSIVDTVYFSTDDHLTCSASQAHPGHGIPEWVILDHQNALKYGVECPENDD